MPPSSQSLAVSTTTKWHNDVTCMHGIGTYYTHAQWHHAPRTQHICATNTTNFSWSSPNWVEQELKDHATYERAEWSQRKKENPKQIPSFLPYVTQWWTLTNSPGTQVKECNLQQKIKNIYLFTVKIFDILFQSIYIYRGPYLYVLITLLRLKHF